MVVPGLQGRWEWAKPALRELARKCRSVSYSLCGDIGSRWRVDPALGFDNYVRQLEAVLDRARPRARGDLRGFVRRIRRAALRVQVPDRVSALVLASVPGPPWHPNPRQSRLARPAVVVGARVRVDVADAAVARGDGGDPGRLGRGCGSFCGRVCAAPPRR